MRSVGLKMQGRRLMSVDRQETPVENMINFHRGSTSDSERGYGVLSARETLRGCSADQRSRILDCAGLLEHCAQFLRNASTRDRSK